MEDRKTEVHEYTETKSEDYGSTGNFVGLMGLMSIMAAFDGLKGKTNVDLEKEVSELKGKVDVIEKLVTK